jgi:hypothetical protein
MVDVYMIQGKLSKEVEVPNSLLNSLAIWLLSSAPAVIVCDSWFSSSYKIWTFG